MKRTRDLKSENAQGMVEFALVLPILLLVILAVFAFGHMFFAYTSVVSASREAARYGAVVGQGSGGRLRFQDCDGIRSAAERVGRFAGVGATATSGDYDDTDPGIFIGYDGGPSTTVYDDCPVGSTGPIDVGLGDRILVRVSIDYKPIVPLVSIPSFPLTATTARTIVKDVEVGQAPTAVPGCTTVSADITITTQPPPAELPALVAYVGQPIIPSVTVKPSDGSKDLDGQMDIYMNGAIVCADIPVTDDSPYNGCKIVMDEVGDYAFSVDYTSSDPNQCHAPIHENTEQSIEVIAADTNVTLQVLPPTASNEDAITAVVRVAVTPPGGGALSGTVGVTATPTAGGSTLACNILTLNEVDGVLEGSCDLAVVDGGATYLVKATFTPDLPPSGNPNYNPSAAELTFTVPPDLVTPTSTRITGLSPQSVNEGTRSITVNFSVDSEEALKGSVVVTASGVEVCRVEPINESDGSYSGSCGFSRNWTPGQHQIKATFYPSDPTQATVSDDVRNLTVNAAPTIPVCTSINITGASFTTSGFKIDLKNDNSGKARLTGISVKAPPSNNPSLYPLNLATVELGSTVVWSGNQVPNNTYQSLSVSNNPEIKNNNAASLTVDFSLNLDSKNVSGEYGVILTFEKGSSCTLSWSKNWP